MPGCKEPGKVVKAEGNCIAGRKAGWGGGGTSSLSGIPANQPPPSCSPASRVAEQAGRCHRIKGWRYYRATYSFFYVPIDLEIEGPIFVHKMVLVGFHMDLYLWKDR